MGFFDFIGEFFGGLSGSPSAGAPAAPAPRSGPPPARPPAPVAVQPRPPVDKPETRREVLTGRVTHVEESGDRPFVRVASPTASGVVYAESFGRVAVGTAPDGIQVGQEVEFVVVTPDFNNRGRYLLSFDLVDEVRRRDGIDRLAVGDTVEAVVLNVEDDTVSVLIGPVVGIVPAAELARHYVHSARDEVAPSDTVSVTITRIECPHSWRRVRFEPRYAAFFEGTLRPSLPTRDVRITVPFSAVPFRIGSRANLPRRFDPVVSFVFSALAEGHSAESIAHSTALTLPAVREITHLIEELGLLLAGTLTREGESIAQAIRMSDDLNAEPIDGWFISAAPPGRTLAPPGGIALAAHRDGWPAALRTSKLEDAFFRASEDALAPGVRGVGYAIEDLVDDAVVYRLAELHAHPRARVFVQPTRRSPTQVELEVPDAWVFGLLWRAFDSAQAEVPFQPAYDDAHAARIHVAECARHVPGPSTDAALDSPSAASPGSAGTPEAPPRTITETVYWEPATDTLWHRRAQPEARLTLLPLRSTPAIPDALHQRTPDPLDVPFAFVGWARVEHRPPRAR